MSDEEYYLARVKPERLDVNPGRAGAYVRLAHDDEVVLGEINVTERQRLAISAFYVDQKTDYDRYVLSKLRYDRKRGWILDQQISINKFQLQHVKEFNSIIQSLNVSNSQKVRLDLNQIHVESLSALLNSNKSNEIIDTLSQSPHLKTDIIALAYKRQALQKFSELLCSDTSEADWQSFFEENKWIFGHGLGYVVLDPVGPKFEATSTGSSAFTHGKRSDGLARTRAEISQFVFIEIKRSNTLLLNTRDYRPGCWPISSEIQGAVTQIQKTVHDFCASEFPKRLRDHDGEYTGEEVYGILPKSFLIAGNLRQLRDHPDKITSFELFRRNLHSPEIVTFDELYYKAEVIVRNLEHNHTKR